MGKHILLLLQLTTTSLLSGSLYAANNKFCTNYANLGTEQYKASVEYGCGFSGLRWNDDTAGQKQWCLTVDELTASKETLARAEALIQCKMSHATPNNKELTYKEQEALTQALIDATQKDDLTEIKRLIRQGADIHRELDGNFGTPLFAAIGAQAENAVKFFVEQGVDPQRTSNGGENPLNYLLRGSKDETINYDLLDYLLEHGVSPNGPGESGDIPLHVAIENNDDEAVKHLLQHGADANLQVYAATTPLITAINRSIKNKKTTIVKHLLEFGANPNVSNFGQDCGDVTNEANYSEFPLALTKESPALQKLLRQFGAKDKRNCINTHP